MKIIKILSILFFNISYFAQTDLEKYITDDDGIIVEKPDRVKNYDNIYNDNNIIYKDGRKRYLNIY